MGVAKLKNSISCSKDGLKLRKSALQASQNKLQIISAKRNEKEAIFGEPFIFSRNFEKVGEKQD